MTRLEKLRHRLHVRKANRLRKQHKKQGARAKREARAVRKLREAIRALLRRGPLTMFDDTSIGLIPADAKAVAGYVNGLYETWPEIVARFPKARKLSIAVTSDADADCLDVEPGDATNADVVAWFKRQKHVHHKPTFYTSVSNADALVDTLKAAGIHRGEYKLWTAHYDGSKHICEPATCGECRVKADATQWTSTARSRSLDQSRLRPHFFS